MRHLRGAAMWRAPCHGENMALTGARFVLVILLLYAGAGAAVAESLSSPHTRRIRTFDAHLHALVEQGLRESQTFRVLAGRIEQSDVIVYLLPDISPPTGVAGRLTFLSASGSVRYVAVRLRPLGSTVRELAMLAHELQHAVEIAERPSIVDQQTLAREYLRFGHVNPSMPQGTAFDTRDAVEAGYRVYRELASIVAAPDVHASGE
jgi:hypothetical protein